MKNTLPVIFAAVFAAAPLAAPAQNIAKVNGVAIPVSRAESMLRELAAQGRADSPQLRQAVRDELISREIMLQEAGKLKLATLPEIANQLDFARQNVLVRAYVQEYFKKNPITDVEVKAEYDRLKKDLGDREYRARHILVKSEDEAKGIVAKLKAGGKFEDLAKASEDPGSKEKGGDLDWATAGTFVPEFAKAMTALKKGEFTETPVKTQFGFHVIRLDDTRDAQVPGIDEARPQISQQLQRQRFDRMLGELRAKAKIE
jgi:peptidyl-prolyl cis-trans isomerase C